MNRRQQNAKGSRIRSLIVICVLAGVCLSSIGGLWALLAFKAPAALGQGSLLTHASLTDSAAARLEKRIQNFESKTYRRLMPFAPPSPRIEPGLFNIHNRYLSESQSEQFYSLATVSPPGDRAPPLEA